MKKEYILHPKALEEAIKSSRFYHGRGGKKLADRFNTEIHDALEEIEKDPSRHRYVGDNIQTYGPTKTFSYRIYFIEGEDVIKILAVAHPSRKPRYWSRRKFNAR